MVGTEYPLPGFGAYMVNGSAWTVLWQAPLPSNEFGNDATAINDSGQVTGYQQQTGFGGPSIAVRDNRSSNGSLEKLGTLNGGSSSAGNAINDNGDVAGDSNTANGQTHAFVYVGNGPMQDIQTLPVATSSTATGINDSGQVVGNVMIDGSTFAFLYTSSNGMQLVPPLPGDTGSTATAINNSGLVIGTSGSANYGRAFLYSSTTGIQAIFPGKSTANGINNAGMVVGVADLDVPQQFGGISYSGHAALYENGAAEDLNSLIDPASGLVLVRGNGA